MCLGERFGVAWLRVPSNRWDSQKQKVPAYGDVSVEELGRRLADASGIREKLPLQRPPLQGTGRAAYRLNYGLSSQLQSFLQPKHGSKSYVSYNLQAHKIPSVRKSLRVQQEEFDLNSFITKAHKHFCIIQIGRKIW